MVSDLIDSSTRQWNVTLIANMFNQHDVEQICSIPISRTGANDVLVWHYEESGVYSVKSGYLFINSIEAPPEDMENDQTEIEMPRGKMLWRRRARIPNKIRIFAWRLS